MPNLLSGGKLRKGGSGQFIYLEIAMPQLPANADTSTGYTIVTDSLLRTTYRNSLGNLEHYKGEIWSNLPDGKIKLTGTGTGFVYVTQPTVSTSTDTGALVVQGGIGVGGTIWTEEDIHVNGVTIGRGYKGINNIAIRGEPVEDPLEDYDFPDGKHSVAIGFGALTELQSSVKSIAIGRYALSSGTNISNSIALGDRTLQKVGAVHSLFVSTITGFTSASPAIVTAPNHGLTTGTKVTLLDVSGFGNLAVGPYWANRISNDQVSLYVDSILYTPLDATGFIYNPPGGELARWIETDNNIAFGTNAGRSLVEGEKNLFFGDQVAKNLITGTGNVFVGHDIGIGLTKGNFNIAIGGDNLVDGIDNQVNIGSVFYYNGGGYLQLNANTGAGLGSTATDSYTVGFITSATQTNPVLLTIQNHGLTSGDDIFIVGAVGMIELNDKTFWVRKISKDIVELHSSINVSSTATNIDGTGYSAYVGNGKLIEKRLSGAFTVLGGIGATENLLLFGNFESRGTGTNTIAGDLIPNGLVNLGSPTNRFKDVYISGTTIHLSTVTLKSPDALSFKVESIEGPVTQTVGNLYLNSGVSSSGIASGSLVITGGAGISGDLYVGGLLNVTGPENVNLSPIGGTVRLRPELGGTVEIYPATIGTLDNLDIGVSSPRNGYFLNLTALSTSNSTSAVSGAIQVAGGVGIGKDLYVGGTIYGSIVGSNTTSTNLAGGSLGSIPYQTAPGVTDFIPIGTTNTVLVSNGSTATWNNLENINAGTSNTATFAQNIFVNTATTNTSYYLGLTEVIGNFSPVDSTSALIFDTTENLLTTNKLEVISTASSTSTTTSQALTVHGGVGIEGDVYTVGSIYSKDGIIEHNNLLYTPRVVISATPPTDPRVGDFWIDPTYGVELQYIIDGTNPIWVQFAGF